MVERGSRCLGRGQRLSVIFAPLQVAPDGVGQEDDEEDRHDVVHPLDVADGRVANAPDVKDPRQPRDEGVQVEEGQFVPWKVDAELVDDLELVGQEVTSTTTQVVPSLLPRPRAPQSPTGS